MSELPSLVAHLLEFLGIGEIFVRIHRVLSVQVKAHEPDCGRQQTKVFDKAHINNLTQPALVSKGVC